MPTRPWRPRSHLRLPARHRQRRDIVETVHARDERRSIVRSAPPCAFDLPLGQARRPSSRIATASALHARGGLACRRQRERRDRRHRGCRIAVRFGCHLATKDSVLARGKAVQCLKIRSGRGGSASSTSSRSLTSIPALALYEPALQPSDRRGSRTETARQADPSRRLPGAAAHHLSNIGTAVVDPADCQALQRRPRSRLRHRPGGRVHVHRHRHHLHARYGHPPEPGGGPF